MFNSVKVIAEAFGQHLAATYQHYNGNREPEYATLIDAGARLIVERIAGSDALYHDVNHTILVTLVGQDILRGKLLHEVIAPDEWLHFTFALLCHDIGYVRGVCSADRPDSFVINEDGDRVTLPRGASDAALTPYHVERGKIFVKERCAMSPYLDGERLGARDRADALSYTRRRRSCGNRHRARAGAGGGSDRADGRSALPEEAEPGSTTSSSRPAQPPSSI